MDRYFIDERVGCLAIRDRRNTDPTDQGLHRDTKGVMHYWGGTRVSEPCPTCGHSHPSGWAISYDDKDVAKGLCEKMNRGRDLFCG